MLTHFWPLLFLLFAGHALCDYPLQGTFLSMAKQGEVKGFPWGHALFAHALIHAGMVLALTHSVGLALCELVLHFLIDLAKIRRLTSLDTDQMLHYTCKILWAVLACFGYLHRY